MDSTSPLKIRYATMADAADIALVHVKSWQRTYRGHIPDNILDALSTIGREQQWRYLMQHALKILVIERGARILGFASICPARDQDLDATVCGEISALYIHPEEWRQGHGKALCKAAMAALAAMQFTEVMLWVLAENDQARQFYAAMGFRETGHTKTEVYYQDVNLHEVRYQMKISAPA